MNILHVISDLAPESGGPVTALLGMASAAATRGITTRILTSDHGLREGGLPGLSVRVVKCNRGAWRWSPGIARALCEELAETDVAHLHGIWSHPIVSAARACRKANVPYVLRPCGMLDSWALSQKRMKKLAYLGVVGRSVVRGAAALHFTTEDEHIRSRTFGHRGRSVVVPLGVPESAFSKLPPRGRFRAFLGEIGQGPLVLFLGRLHSKKQPELLLQAFVRIAARHPNARLVMAGPGDLNYVGMLQRESQRLGLGRHVCFPGLLREEAVREAMVDADVFVLPSLQENFGVAVAEAMAASVPVVVTRNVGLWREIVEGEAGLAIDSDEAELAGAVEALISDRERARRMGENGRRLVVERYTWKTVGSLLESLYRSMASSAILGKET